MNVPEKEIKEKKRIGKVGYNPVYEISTIGGLVLNVLGKGASFEVIGASPHAAMTRYLSQKRCPSIEFNELHKCEKIDFDAFKDLVQEYQELTEQLRQSSK